MNKSKLVIIDAFDLLHRAYYVIPKTLTNKKGQSINAAYGFTLMLISLLDKLKPEYIVVAMEGGTPTFRVEEFKAYKATRKVDLEKDKAFAEQIPIVKEVLEAFEIPYLFFPGFEADDIIGTIAQKQLEARSVKQELGNNLQASNFKLQTVVVTNDQDMLQLVDEDTSVFMPAKGKDRPDATFTPELVEKKYGFKPKQMVDFKALRGDPSDNIPGVFGIGEKKATELVRQFGSLEEIYKNISLLDKKTAGLLAEGKEDATMSRYLATIREDAPIDFSLEKCRFREVDKVHAAEKIKELGFKSLARRLVGKEPTVKGMTASSDQISLF